MFIAVHIGAYFTLHRIARQAALDDAFIAALSCNYRGRSGVVLLMALPLVGGHFEALMGRAR